MPVRFADALRAFPKAGPFLWSHHPVCSFFQADVLRIGSTRVCIACFIGLPMIAVGALAARAFEPHLQLGWWVWLLIGLALALPQGLSFAGRVPTTRAQVLLKLSLGTGLGFVIFGLLATPLPFWGRIAALVVGMLGIQSFWVLRLHRLDRTCNRCPERPIRPRCTGLIQLDDAVGAVLRGQA